MSAEVWVSELVDLHGLTLREGAMVCKAGDWPEGVEYGMSMPESEELFSKEAMDYSLNRILGHREHLAGVLDEAQAQTWDEAAEATAEWMATNPGPSGIPADPPRNPYRDDAVTTR